MQFLYNLSCQSSLWLQYRITILLHFVAEVFGNCHCQVRQIMLVQLKFLKEIPFCSVLLEPVLFGLSMMSNSFQIKIN